MFSLFILFFHTHCETFAWPRMSLWCLFIILIFLTITVCLGCFLWSLILYLINTTNFLFKISLEIFRLFFSHLSHFDNFWNIKINNSSSFILIKLLIRRKKLGHYCCEIIIDYLFNYFFVRKPYHFQTWRCNILNLFIFVKK